MKSKLENKASLKNHRFLEVTEKIRKHITGLPVSSPVPSTTFWREKLGASRSTITKAFAELKSEGVLTTKIGSGTVTAQIARTKTVLILWDTPTSRAHKLAGAEFLTGCGMACEKYGNVLVSHLNAEKLTSHWDPRHLFPGLCGVLFFRSPSLAEKLSPSLTQQKIPWLLYGSSAYAKGVQGLAVDESFITNLAMEAFQKAGHSQIGMLYRMGHPPGIARYEAWKEWHWKNKISLFPERVWTTQPGSELNQNHLRVWLKNVSAVFCATDADAVELLEQVRPMGIRIPKDLSVIGVDNEPLVEKLIPGLTSIDIPIENHGQIAIDQLLKKPWTTTAPLSDAELVSRGTLFSFHS